MTDNYNVTDNYRAPTQVDESRPSVARMYDYFLGGKDNFVVDRNAAEKVLAAVPEGTILARQNRAFLGRAVRYLAETGIRQFLDLGTGLPTQDNVHQVAQRVAPDARVVYVDNDPTACIHGRALLADENTVIIEEDIRRPEKILDHPDVQKLIDFDQPVAILFVAVLHFLSEEDHPAKLVARFREAMAPNSHIVISHATTEDHAEGVKQGATVYRSVRATSEVTLRTREEILPFFDGMELVEPGVVAVSDWRPNVAVTEVTHLRKSQLEKPSRLPTWFLCGVGRKQ